MAVYKSKTPTKDGRQYFFRIKYKDILGIVHDYSSAKFKNLKDAKNEEALYRIKINNQKAYISTITIEESYLEFIKYKEKNLKEISKLKYNELYKHLSSIKDKKINDLDLHYYNMFLNELDKNNLSVNYKNKILGLLKQIIKFSSKYNNTSDKLLKYIENYKDIGTIKKEMDFFTYDEYKQFEAAIDNINWKAFFQVLYYMGFRRGETQSLNWNDIDFENNKIKITKTLTTKIVGEKYTITSPKTKSSNRTLPMPKVVYNSLKEIKNNAMKDTNFSNDWFVFGSTLPFPETTIAKKKNDYCKLANVKQIRIHDFRHSCASLLINHGANIALVSKYLGHSNISITLNTYTHLYQSELESMTEILNKL